MSGRFQRPRGILFDIGDTLLYLESLDPALGLDRLLQLATNSDVIDAAGFQDAGKSHFDGLSFEHWDAFVGLLQASS